MFALGQCCSFVAGARATFLYILPHVFYKISGMKISFRTIFLKSLPYLMSIAGGIILYTGAIDNAPNDNIRDLVINVSASLFLLPSPALPRAATWLVWSARPCS